MKRSIEYKIAKRVKEYGGSTYYVGGYVRDKLLGIKNKDIDIEVHEVDVKTLKNILSEFGSVKTYGSNFGIFSVSNIDIALPRIEKNTGRGHKDFEVFVDPYIGTKKASIRRDFTINALMQDVLSLEIIDHFNGIKDLNKKVIRHINDDSFVEDPLRVLRAAQFASRFNFKISNKTINLCKQIDITALPFERVEEELKKALLQADKPSLFFEYLKKMNQLDYWFYELKQLIGLKQNRKHHPEGDVWKHTMIVLDEASKYRKEVSDPYSFMLLALCHDLGKIETTQKINGVIHSYGHEKQTKIIKTFLKRFTNNSDVIKYVCNMSTLHMKPNVLASNNSSIKSSNHMFDDAYAPKDLIYFALCDHIDNDLNIKQYLFDRYNLYIKTMKKPYVTGNDLIAYGLKPNDDLKKILEYAHLLQLAGIDSKSCLKQTLSYAKKLTKS